MTYFDYFSLTISTQPMTLSVGILWLATFTLLKSTTLCSVNSVFQIPTTPLLLLFGYCLAHPPQIAHSRYLWEYCRSSPASLTVAWQILRSLTQASKVGLNREHLEFWVHIRSQYLWDSYLQSSKIEPVAFQVVQNCEDFHYIEHDCGMNLRAFLLAAHLNVAWVFN